MNEAVLHMKQKKRAMRSYVLLIYELVLESKPDYVLEIGTGQCQSARTILGALSDNKKGKLVSIDLRDKRYKIPDDLKSYFHQIIGNSHTEDIFNKVKEQFNKPIDILFIDGDHKYCGVKKDFEMYVPLVKKGGLILMHDTCNNREGVKDFWKEIKYPKVNLEYGTAAYDIVPGLGIIQKNNE